jgi:hypothetical protein
MDYEEDEVTDEQEKMNGPSRLSAPEKPRIPRESVDSRRRHRDAGEHRKRRHDENHSKIGELLKRVATVKPVRFRRQVEGCVMNEDVPSARNNIPGSGDESFPLGGAKEEQYENEPV